MRVATPNRTGYPAAAARAHDRERRRMLGGSGDRREGRVHGAGARPRLRRGGRPARAADRPAEGRLRPRLPRARLLVGRRLRLRPLPRRPRRRHRLPRRRVPRRGGLAARPAPAHGARLDPDAAPAVRGLRPRGAGLVALRPLDDRRPLPARGGGRRHRRRGARRPAGARRLGRRRAALRPDAPRARRREPPRERDLLPRRQRLPGRGGDLRPLHPGEQPHGGDRGPARGAGDPLDQRRAGGRGVRAADRRSTRRRSVRAPSPRIRC